MMQYSYNGSIIWKSKKKKIFMGINLGADASAEHEVGIRGLKKAFGCSDGLGLDSKKINQCPGTNIRWLSNDLFEGIVFQSYPHHFKYYEHYLPTELNAFRGSNREEYTDLHFQAKWDESSFSIMVVKNTKSAKYIKELYDAFLNKDIVVWVGGGGLFNNPGLCFGIISKMPQHIFDDWYKKDKEKADLWKEFNDLGLEKELRDKEKDWFYLGPKFKENGKLKIWLNPYKQDIYNYGYFTVEELRQWGDDKGPIVKANNKPKPQKKFKNDSLSKQINKIKND